MRVDALSVGELQVNCYILSSSQTRNAIIIDPGDDYPKINSFLEKHKLSPKFIVHTLAILTISRRMMHSASRSTRIHWMWSF